MAIIKCKMCGGDIELSADKTYGTCDSCGSTMTFPKVSDEQRANLFNRANHFRRQNEFDKAVSAYERILDEDDTDAEAHWGVVLSRYGIEYVEDPVSHERIPTCHRVQSASILTDADYLAALEYAPDAHSKELYEQEARRIADIQKGILAISSKEEPYDVFICYKESTDGGSRTKDSTLAQDIFYQLTQDGYKVFFSRITLEDKLGQQYEPYIFAALNSARVMVVVGTKPEYFNAVWVKNEWSRYLALMKQDKSRLLIPCYRDMDPYDLPEELSALQSLDMGKIGFMQDLVHGIQKVLEKKAEPQTAHVSDAAAAPGVTSLLKRAKLFLEDGDFASADEYAEKVLDIDPECAAAYLVKVLVSRQLKTETELGDGNVSLANDTNYAKALRFAMPEQKQTYASYEQSIQENIRRLALQEAYGQADKMFRQARYEDDYRRTAEAFERLGHFSDATERVVICQDAAEKMRAETEATQKKALAEQKRLEEEKAAQEAQQSLERKHREEVQKLKNERTKRRNRTVALIFGTILTVSLVGGLLLKLVILPQRQEMLAEDAFASKDYAAALGYYISLPQTDERKAQEYALAQTCYNEENYRVAVEAYEALGQYELSAQRLPLARYAYADQLFQQGQYLEACEQFSQIKEVSDSAVRANESKYQAAKALQAEGQFAQAEGYYAELGSYSDSAEQLNACQYNQAAQALANGNYGEALHRFEALTYYQDSATQLKEAHYQWAEALMSAKDYASAEQQYALLVHGHYKDSEEKMNVCILAQADTAFSTGNYAEAEELYRRLPASNAVTVQINACLLAQAKEKMNGGSYDTALTFLNSINDDSSAETIAECHYQLGLSAQREGNTPKAVQEFAQAVLLDKAKDALCQIGKDYASVNENAHAIETLAAVANYEPARKLLNEITELLQTRQQNELVYIVYVVTNDEAARKERLTQVTKESLAEALIGFDIGWDTDFANKVLYQHAVDLESDGQYDQASTAFENLGEYMDAAERIGEPYYIQAEKILAAGNIDEAYEIFLKAGYYSDAETRAKALQYQKAEELLKQKDYDGANKAFQLAKDYSNAKERIGEPYYLHGSALMNIKDYRGALCAYGKSGNYADGRQKARSMLRDKQIVAANCYTAAVTSNGGVILTGSTSLSGDSYYRISTSSYNDWKDITAIVPIYDFPHIVGLKSDGTLVGEHEQSEEWKNITTIVGGACVIGIKADGTIVCDDSDLRSFPNINEWNDLIDISRGVGVIIGLKKNGTVVATHGDFSPWLNNSELDAACRVKDWKNIIAIEAGDRFTVGLKRDGTVVAVGINDNKQCNVSDWRDIVAITIVNHATVGLKKDGTLITTDASFPINDVKDIVAINGCRTHLVCLKSDGTLTVINNNYKEYGQSNVSSWKNIGRLQPEFE